MPAINVAIVGVGNCARSLLEGIALHRVPGAPEHSTGVSAVDDLGGYRIADIEFVAAFDVSAKKVGKDLAQAILAPPNETIPLASVPPIGVAVLRGPTLDGISDTCQSLIPEAAGAPVDVGTTLRNSGADIVVNYLPVGSNNATRFYASAAVEAGCAFVNCTTTPIAAAEEWRAKFESARLPVIGDDIKSQMGATILHRTLLRLFRDRGVGVVRSYQLNIGGNADFLNMSQPERGLAKEESKVRSIESLIGRLESVPVTASVGYVSGLGDRKTAYIRIEGATFGAAPVNLEVKLDVWDSPNSAGVVVDAIRYGRIAMERNFGGPVNAACAYLMKSPPEQMDEDEALRALEELLTSQL